MDEKISLKALEHYSQEFALKISSAFFMTRDKISGPEILSLCGIHQVNLFVIRELLYSWKAESEKLRSPYFNYNAKDVADAMTVFQNALSNNISISELDFRPLLTKGVSRTLNVILSPYDFYSEVLDRQVEGIINVGNLRNDIRYLRINRAPLEKLIAKLDEKKISMVQRNEAFALLDSILEEVGFNPEDIEGYLTEFSKVIPLTIETLYEGKNLDPETKIEEPVAARPVEPVFNRPAVVSERPINKPTEKIARAQVTNLHKISRIKDSLTINQKFMFTKILFHGDFEIFSQAIDRLDILDNFSQAENYLSSTYPEWDKESVEFLEFREMLERRFA